MKVFLDTNIILDILLEREGYEDCVEWFSQQDQGNLHLCTSVLSMANIAYVYRKTVGPEMIFPNIKYLSALLEILPMDGDMLQDALLMKGKDFEDNLQYVCAKKAACDRFITRNIKDFHLSSQSPGETGPLVCLP